MDAEGNIKKNLDMDELNDAMRHEFNLDYNPYKDLAHAEGEYVYLVDTCKDFYEINQRS